MYAYFFSGLCLAWTHMQEGQRQEGPQQLQDHGGGLSSYPGQEGLPGEPGISSGGDLGVPAQAGDGAGIQR